MVAGDIVRIPQDENLKGRRPRPKFRDGLIETNKAAEQVYIFVAACAQRYSLFAECGGDRFFVKDALSYDPEGELSFGYVLSGDRLILGCKSGVVELLLKPEGALFAGEYRE